MVIYYFKAGRCNISFILQQINISRRYFLSHQGLQDATGLPINSWTLTERVIFFKLKNGNSSAGLAKVWSVSLKYSVKYSPSSQQVESFDLTRQ